MFNRMIQNTRKPEGFLGRMMLKGMNAGHASLAEWGFSFLTIPQGAHVLDVGCGGGANIAKILRDMPDSVVDGLDYSDQSVAYSRRTNAAHLGERCTIRQGDVASLPYPDGSLDLVTAFETVYFWPDLDAAFTEIRRVLKADGRLFICCEADDPSDTTWTDRIEGMTVHRGEDLERRLVDLGFREVQVHRNDRGWMCLTAVRGI
jgi:ubiquinone/menaquinone biosynthesis C-methylase UbiE